MTETMYICNVSSATIPMPISSIMASMLTKLIEIIACGFGVGYSWGSTILKF